MKKGFTLIELLVVVLIIGILSAIALPQYTTAVEKARSTEALTNMGTIAHAGERYYMQTTTWPGTTAANLDIEVPTLKYYTPSYANSGTNGWIITMDRGGSDGQAYKLYTAVTNDGQIKRFCGSAAPTISVSNGVYTITKGTDPTSGGAVDKMCKAISGGKGYSGDW